MIDKIFYINLDRRTDRNQHIIDMFNECNISDDMYERFSAIEEVNGAMGCTKSHINILQIAKERNYNYILIVEDDLIINDKINFINNVNKIFEDNINFDVIQISGNVLRCTKSDYVYLSKLIDSQTTSGYIVNCQYIDKLIENYTESLNSMILEGKKHENCLDIHWKVLQKTDNWYIFNPKLGYQMDGYSDIEKRITKYGC
jgi:glycosyl transferase family 25